MHAQRGQHGANAVDEADPLGDEFRPLPDAAASRRSCGRRSSSVSLGIGTIEHTRGSPRSHASSVRCSNSASIPSDLARRPTGTLEG